MTPCVTDYLCNLFSVFDICFCFIVLLVDDMHCNSV